MKTLRLISVLCALWASCAAAQTPPAAPMVPSGGGGGSSGITVGSTTITGGTNTRILFNNSGVVGEYTLQGSGTAVAMATSPSFTTPALGVATATSIAIGGCTIGTDTFCNTGTTTLNGAVVVNAASFGLSGNISAPAWTTAGVRYKNVAATLTDTTSSGTVAAARTDNFGGSTIAASSVTTYTNYYTAYFTNPVAGNNVTMTNKAAIGADSIAINGCTIGSNGFCVTGTAAFSSSMTGFGFQNFGGSGFINRNASLNFLNPSSGQFAWATSTDGAGTLDAGLARANGGVVKVTNGTTGDGAFQLGATALTLAANEFGLQKITASGSAPGASGGKLALVCGTNAGSAKLIAYAGTSTTPVTILDNIGSGVTGC